LQTLTPDLLTYIEQFTSADRIIRLKEVLAKRTNYITVVTDQVVDPHNISAICRSAECFGVQNIHLIEGDFPFRGARKIQRGSLNWVNVNRYDGVDKTQSCIKTLKNKGYKIVAVSPHAASKSIADLTFDKPIALVMGQEQRGVSEELMDAADECVIIPMQGFTESLNVSVACSIALYDLRKRLEESNVSWQLSESDREELYQKWLFDSIKRPDLIIEHYNKTIANK
jgi:tRNA (guanosine-2'-O-)-methyltransferase